MKYAPTKGNLDRVESAGYGQRAITKLPSGVTYTLIEVVTNLVNRGTLQKIAIDVNGSEIVYATGAELHVIDRYLKKHTADGRFVLDLARFEYRSMAGIRQKELVTFPNDEVTLIMEFGSKDAADPDTLSVRATAYTLDNQTDRYFIPSMLRTTLTIPAQGEYEYMYANADVSRYIQRLAFNESAVTISRIEIWRDRTRIFEATREDYEFDIQRMSGGERAPVAGWFIFDPTIIGFGSDGALNTGKKDSLKFKLTCSNAGALPVLIEGFEQVKKIPAPQ